jgi:hypothetical protein
VSQPSKLNRFCPHWDGKAFELLAGVRVLLEPYRAKTIVLLKGWPADCTARQINWRRKAALGKIVNDQPPGGHTYNRRH